jgi:simple sugar transport system permease protein
VTALTLTPARRAQLGKGAVRWVVALGAAIVIFGVFMASKGANPIEAYRSMWTSLGSDRSVQSVLVKSIPLILAALAVAVPARAGLVNVGGEGQLIMGGVFAVWASHVVGEALPGQSALLVLCLAGAVGGAVWAAVAVALRILVGISEAVATLLLNYVALNVMYALIGDAWKDPKAAGQLVSKELPVGQRFSLLGSTTVHAGLLVAIVATAVVWWVLRSTRWGFQLRVVGGNPEAARRAGLKVGALLLGAMLVGGALAGLGGVTQLAGTEFRLRQGFLVNYGYIGFLASWLARHHPVKVALAAVALAAISISGDSLQIDSALPAATVNVLMALVLLAAFGWGAKRRLA